ncbi:DUF6468 domain-containing protein [Phenylobacterium sp.]|uniref:DUF6468 domain-containing protein n=1 Tax=Phenylobacterium sp. TaxID=1871053 RepID=UPI002FDA7ABD
MNLLLAVLLLAALAMGWRLNQRLKALRDSHAGFAQAVADLDQAARRAEQGLADLRAATDEAADTLDDRIKAARELSARLERQVKSGPVLAEDEAAERAAEHRLGALLAGAHELRPARPRLEPVPPARRPASVERPLERPLERAGARPVSRMARALEDDLFDAPAEAVGELRRGRR